MSAYAHVPRWGVLERSYAYAAADGNPFDIAIHGVFTHEGGRRLRVDGFCDGDATYRVRAMPDAVGRWEYRVVIEGRVVDRGAFLCAPSALKGPLVRDPAHPEHFLFADGTPYYMLGNTAYNAVVAHRNARAAFREFLDHYARRRFNWVRFFLQQTTWPTLGGVVWPWGGAPEEPDWRTFSPTTFREAEGVIRELAARDMIASVILLHPADEAFARLAPERRVAVVRRYLRYAVARLGACWNVVWNLANEWQRGEAFTYDEMDDLGDYLHRIDPYGHLTACHHYGRFEFFDRAWTDMSSLQHRGLPHEVHRRVLQNKGLGKVVLNEEYGYEGDNHSPPNDPDNVRHDHWAIATAGGYGTYGDKTKGPKVAVYFSSVLEDAVGTAVPDALQHLHAFMSETPYRCMRPADEFLSECDPDEAFCLADPGREYIVYMVRAQEVTLNLTHDRGTLAARWLNPRTGEVSPEEDVRVAQGTEDLPEDERGQTALRTLRALHVRRFRPPREDGDWVLHLRARGGGV